MRWDDHFGHKVMPQIDEVDEQTRSCALEMRLQGWGVAPAWIVRKLFKRHKGLRRVMPRQCREPRDFGFPEKVGGLEIIKVGRQYRGGGLAHPREHGPRRRELALVIEQVESPGKGGGYPVGRHRLDDR